MPDMDTREPSEILADAAAETRRSLDLPDDSELADLPMHTLKRAQRAFQHRRDPFADPEAATTTVETRALAATLGAWEGERRVHDDFRYQLSRARLRLQTAITRDERTSAFEEIAAIVDPSRIADRLAVHHVDATVEGTTELIAGPSATRSIPPIHEEDRAAYRQALSDVYSDRANALADGLGNIGASSWWRAPRRQTLKYLDKVGKAFDDASRSGGNPPLRSVVEYATLRFEVHRAAAAPLLEVRRQQVDAIVAKRSSLLEAMADQPRFADARDYFKRDIERSLKKSRNTPAHHRPRVNGFEIVDVVDAVLRWQDTNGLPDSQQSISMNTDGPSAAVNEITARFMQVRDFIEYGLQHRHGRGLDLGNNGFEGPGR